MASRTLWTWVWVNSGRWWWTGKPGVLWFMGSQRVRHDWVTELNWTECDSLGQREINGNCWVRLSGKLIKWACRLSWHALCPVPFYLSAVCSATMMAEVGETLQKSEEMAKRFAEISTLNLFIFIFPNWSIVDLQYCVNFYLVYILVAESSAQKTGLAFLI